MAEKDVDFNLDSETVFQVFDGTLVMTITVYTDKGPVSGSREFTMYDLDDVIPLVRSRRCSSTRRLSGMSPFLRRVSEDVLIEEDMLCGIYRRPSETPNPVYDTNIEQYNNYLQKYAC